MNDVIENAVRKSLRQSCFPQFSLGLIDMVSLSDMKSLVQQWRNDIGQLERVIKRYEDE